MIWLLALLFIPRPEQSRPRPKAKGQGQSQRIPRPRNLALRPRPSINIPVTYLKFNINYPRDNRPMRRPIGAIYYFNCRISKNVRHYI